MNSPIRRLVEFLLSALLVVLPAVAKDKVPLATGEWSPFVSQSLEGQGVFVEILSAAFKEMGMEFELTYVPWPRAEAMVLQGEVFGAFPYLSTEERRKAFDFSDGVVLETGRLFAKKGGNIDLSFNWRTYDDLKPYLIGGVRGYWYEPEFKASGLNVIYSNSEEISLKSLSGGRVDLVPMSELVGWEVIRRIDPGNVRQYFTLSKPLNQSELGLMVSRQYPGSANLLKAFNKALARIRSRGVPAAILKKYGIK